MNSPGFKDHFSGHAQTYCAARPGYPAALFEWLARQAPARGLAWDAGCGNGQASVALAARFERVIATDPSAQQIAQARPHPAVSYRVEPAEMPSLDAQSADVVTVAQAFHWFDYERFYQAVRQVARRGAVVALWSYPVSSVSPEFDAVLDGLYKGVLGGYWPPETDHANDGYARVPFPFVPLETPRFYMLERWDFTRFCAFLRSWSATQLFIREHGRDPVSDFEDRLSATWGHETVRNVRWPVLLRAGRVA